MQSWTTLDVYASAGEQQMLVTGAPGIQRGQHTGPVARTRTVYLVKVAAHDTAHVPVPGYTFQILDAAGHVVVASVTTGSKATDAPLGALTVGATYRAHELSAPPGGKLYVPTGSTTSFVVPPGTATWTLVAADPEIPTPAVTTHVTKQHAIVGDRLVDDVLVSGDDGENGTLTATLYGPIAPPASGACSDLSLDRFLAAPAVHMSVSIDGTKNAGNGTYRVTGPPAAAEGCWGWGQSLTLSPSGATASSPPTAATESTLVTAPRLATTVSAQLARPGAVLSDHFVVTGLGSEPARVSATLYGPLPASAAHGCTGYDDASWHAALARPGRSLVVAVAVIDVPGDGTYTTNPARVDRPGCYTFGDVLTPSGRPESAVRSPLGLFEESTLVANPQLYTTASLAVGVAGASISDQLIVSGTAGGTGAVSGELLGPLRPVAGSCSGLDWASAPVAAPVAPVPVSGDGTYWTPGVRISAGGCYTFAEVLLLAGDPTPFAQSWAGLPAETVLVAPPATPHTPRSGPPLARTGASGYLLVGGGALTVVAGVACTLVGRRRVR